jgi:hypothetical protein
MAQIDYRMIYEIRVIYLIKLPTPEKVIVFDKQKGEQNVLTFSCKKKVYSFIVFLSLEKFLLCKGS